MTRAIDRREFGRCSGPTPGAPCPNRAWVPVAYKERCVGCTRLRSLARSQGLRRDVPDRAPAAAALGGGARVARPDFDRQEAA